MALILDKTYLNETCGLSCIENYLIYILRANNFPYRYLYGGSVKTFSEIVEYFVREKANYSTFYLIERLHTIARKNNFIRIYSSDELDLGVSETYSCVMVDEAFINTKYKTKLMRPDHYMLLTEADSDSDIYYINDTPRDIDKISREELSGIYAGNTISFEIVGYPSDEQKSEIINNFKTAVGQVKAAELKEVDSIEAARDIVGIYRALLKRNYYFSSLFCVTEFMQDYIKYLDKAYMNIEYMRLRGKGEISEINKILGEINDKDIVITEKLRKAVCAE